MSTKTENFSSRYLAEEAKRGRGILKNIAFTATKNYFDEFLLEEGNSKLFRKPTGLSIVSSHEDIIGRVINLVAENSRGQSVKFTVTIKVDCTELQETTPDR